MLAPQVDLFQLTKTMKVLSSLAVSLEVDMPINEKMMRM